MFCPSEVLLAAVPTPTAMLLFSILRTGAPPDPSRRLLEGLCATRTPDWPSLMMSSSSRQIACAALRRSDRKPRVSRCPTRLLPYRVHPSAAWARDSARWVCSGTSCSLASCAQRIRNSSEQCSGMVGPSAGRIKWRPDSQFARMAAHNDRGVLISAAAGAAPFDLGMSGRRPPQPAMRRGVGADQAGNEHAVCSRQHLCVFGYFEARVLDRKDTAVFDQQILQRRVTLGIEDQSSANDGAAPSHADLSAAMPASNSASVGVAISKRSRIVEQVFPPRRAMVSSLAGSIRMRSTSMTS